MSTQIITADSSSRAVYLVTCRHGGGADHGKYHLFLIGAGVRSFLISIQCVVDDFGTLVDCKTGRPA